MSNRCASAIGSALLLAVAGVGAGPGPAAAAGRTCATAQGPFHVAGTEVLSAGGRAYVPYGITVPGLANAAFRNYTALDDAKIKATAADWCANTVRLQVGQANLVGTSGTSYSSAFMSAIRAEVSLAESEHLVVVLNAQTETVGNQPAPTTATAVFWKDLVGAYGRDPQVVLDLFNEPRVATGGTCGNSRDWHFWQEGGTYRGASYLGMQALVTDVRQDGAANLLWVEGPCYAATLGRAGSHLITGGPLVYAVHHPAGSAPHTSAEWYDDFGFLVNRKIAPVVDGEWTNYASATNPECWTDAPTAVPNYLKYLQSHGIGMTGYQLADGLLIQSASLDDPTHIGTSGTKKWRCANGLDEGAGNQILNWYRQQNES
jgi:hypothetical protein